MNGKKTFVQVTLHEEIRKKLLYWGIENDVLVGKGGPSLSRVINEIINRFFMAQAQKEAFWDVIKRGQRGDSDE